MPFLGEIGFLAHFWQSSSVTFFWRDQKTKSDFFVKNITFHFLSNLFWWLEKLAAVLSQNYFGKFCYCVPPWGILIYGYFGPLGGLLWPCDSLLLWTRLFIQIHSETLWGFSIVTTRRKWEKAPNDNFTFGKCGGSSKNWKISRTEFYRKDQIPAFQSPIENLLESSHNIHFYLASRNITF